MAARHRESLSEIHQQLTALGRLAPCPRCAARRKRRKAPLQPERTTPSEPVGSPRPGVLVHSEDENGEEVLIEVPGEAFSKAG